MSAIFTAPIVQNYKKRFKLKIAYNGHVNGVAHQGWQSQKNDRNSITVQHFLESALSQFADENITIICAGRTDGGVHALGQIIHFDANNERDLYGWVRGVNYYLPHWIRVLDAQHASHDFHARFHAINRTYFYDFYVSDVEIPMLKGFSGWIKTPKHKTFDEENIYLMQQASHFLIGTHDFSSFRSSQCQANSPIRTIYQADWSALHYPCGVSGWRLTLQGNAFLHHMVRNIVGTLLEVGLQRQSVQWFYDVMKAQTRIAAAKTFMPDGLYLADVGY